MVSLLLFGWKDGIQVRHHRNIFPDSPRPTQHQMVAEFRIVGRNKLCGEPKRSETLRGETRQLVYAISIRRVTVDTYHLPQHLERCVQLGFEEVVQRLTVIHGLPV